MSNRNFDSRVIIQRLQQQNYARNLYQTNVNGQRLINNHQNSDGTASRFTSFVSGAQTDYFRGLIGGGQTVNLGGTFGISSTPSSTAQADLQSIPAPSPDPAPTPSPAPVPSPAPIPVTIPPETQLLVNPEFTDIISNGANGWTSSRGWQPYSETSASAPTTVITMPTRDVYPTSTSTGFVIFSFQSATISQTINIDNLIGIDTITGVLNIVNVPNRPTEIGNNADTFTFQIQYKNSTGVVLYTSTTGNIRCPSTWTDYTLTLTRAGSPNFDLIKSITVSITGLDSGYWNGQYGPAIDYCRLIVS